MATFKVGDKARIVNVEGTCHAYLLGLVVRIRALPMYGTAYEIDPPPGERPSFWYSEPCYLAPLTDPKADEFIESIRKLKPLEEEPKKRAARELVEKIEQAMGGALDIEI